MSDLTWEISYLEKNEKPKDNCGRELLTIFAGASNLKDSDIKKLSSALEKNSIFIGGLNIQENLITDLSLLYLTSSLKKSLCLITELNISQSNITGRSGVYLGDLLLTGYKMQELILKGCCVDSIGVQRILESTLVNPHLKALDIGIIHNAGLDIITKYLPDITKLKYLGFQQGSQWSEQSTRNFINNAEKNNSLLVIDVTEYSSSEFVEEFQSIIDRNNFEYNQKHMEKEQGASLDPEIFSKKIQSFIEESIQNLPVRVYLQNALGSLLNDGIFELMKLRFREKDPEKNTAINNIKWLIRYILDRSRS